MFDQGRIVVHCDKEATKAACRAYPEMKSRKYVIMFPDGTFAHTPTKSAALKKIRAWTKRNLKQHGAAAGKATIDWR